VVDFVDGVWMSIEVTYRCSGTEINPYSNFHSRGADGGGASSSSSGSEQLMGNPTSSLNQRLRSAILHRNEQNGISGERTSGTNKRRQVGH